MVFSEKRSFLPKELVGARYILKKFKMNRSLLLILRNHKKICNQLQSLFLKHQPQEDQIGYIIHLISCRYLLKNKVTHRYQMTMILSLFKKRWKAQTPENGLRP